jgi:ATP synthase subunit 6
MIVNLFSSFDPSTSLIRSVWLMLFIPVLFINKGTFFCTTTLDAATKIVTQFVKKEMGQSIHKNTAGINELLVVLFIFIILLNFCALYPQLFAFTSHVCITLPICLTLWLSVICFGWARHSSHMLTHMLPQGTPIALMNFIVLIETVRNLIRPITLCVRLTANLTAGHLLITLLGNAVLSIRIMGRIFRILAPLTLTVLETAVSLIQAYVLATLVTLYSTEVH